MEDMPIVSVIIPVYNGEKYIEKCLEMMARQTYANLEVILVNDGSTDNSAELLEKSPYKVITHDKNKGLSQARNTGIDAAKGKYLHFLDVDDAINDNYYSNMVCALVETDADIALGGMVNERNKSKTQKFKKKSVYVSTKDKMQVSYVGKWGFVWRYVFKLDFIKKNNLRFEVGRFIEDLIFSVPAVYFANKIVTVPNTEYYYSYSENSILTNKDKDHALKRRNDRKHAQEKILQFAEEHNFKLPGVNTGKIKYILTKIKNKIIN